MSLRKGIGFCQQSELDFSSCEIENIAVSSDKLTGVVVNSSQALEFVRLLGIVVKD